ncbi:NADP-binding protein [Candidatus Acetothermia bacterium]|nr:NADP-binding protein [Candidatus Acetothermia bacterium]
MKEIRVVQWGLGAMGSGICKLMLEKDNIEIVGAIAHRSRKVGQDLGKVLGMEKELGVIVTAESNPSAAWKDNGADILLHATCSTTVDAFPQISAALTAGLNVISIAEELAYPHVQQPKLAQALHELACKYGVTLLGTGINPGFVLDSLIIALTGVSCNVERIKARRVNDLSPFGPAVMRTQGVGTTVKEFEQGLADGSIVGHIGFPESITMIADSIGWKLDKIEQTRTPIISQVERKTPHVEVKPGMVAGCNHIGRGVINGDAVIVLEHPQQIHPHLAEIKTGDYIEIEGTPPINLVIEPEIPGGLGTIAIAVNMIPAVLAAPPGLVSMRDLPLPAMLASRVVER